MKTQIRITLIALSLAVTIFNQGCQKEEIRKPVFPSKIAQDNAVAENAFSDLGNQVQVGITQAQDNIENPGKSLNLMNSTCAIVTITPFDLVTFPKTIDIDYGTTGCYGNDGKLRKGKVHITTTGWYREEGTVITITPEDYTVDGVLLEGIEVVTNNGRNVNDNLYYTVFVDGTATTTEGVIQWTSERENEWIAGEPTVLNPWDDEYLITGTQNGVTAQGETYEIVILEPLHIKLNCGYISAGSLRLTSPNLQSDVIVDYGDGDCDNIAVITYNGQSYTIIMQ